MIRHSYLSISGGGSYTKEMTLIEAFAQLVGHELGVFTECTLVNPRAVRVSFTEITGIASSLYESDEASEMLPLIAAVAYNAVDNNDQPTLNHCRELLGGSGFTIEPSFIKDAWRFNTSKVIALSVAGIVINEKTAGGRIGPWALALKVAPLFYDEPLVTREEILEELVSV